MDRRLLLGLAVAVGVLSSWWLVETLVDVDRHRESAERELELLAGVPAAIERLDLRLLPRPRISALRVRLGDEALAADAERVDLVPDLSQLLRGRLALHRIEIDGLRLALPGESPMEGWEALRAWWDAASAGTGDATTTTRIHRVELEDLRVVQGPEREPLLRGGIRLADPGGEPRVRLDLELPRLGATCRGELAAATAGGVATLTGAVRLSGLRTDAVAPLPEALRAAADLRLAIEGSVEEGLALRFEGDLDPDVAEGPRGPVSGRFDLKPGPQREIGFELALQGLRTQGAWRLDEAGSQLRLASLSAADEALRVLSAALGDLPLRVEGSAAALEAEDWWIELPHEGPPRLRSGTLEIDGVEARWGERSLDTPWRLAAHVEAGSIVVDALSSGPLELTGAVAPAADWERWEIRASGNAELEPALLERLGLGDSLLSPLRGRLVLQELHAALPADPDAPPRLRARLVDGTLPLAALGLEGSLTGLELELGAQDGRFEIRGRGRSAQAGELVFSAAGAVGGGALRGSLAFDAATLVPHLPEGNLSAVLAALLRAHGRTELELEATPSEAPAESTTLVVVRKRAPELRARIELPAAEGSPWIGDASLAAQLPAAVFASLVPEAAKLAGDASFQAVLRRSDATFQAGLDLARLGLRYGDWIDKRAGEPLLVTADGSSPDAAPWTLEEVVLSSQGDRLRLRRSGERWIAGPLQLDLARWAVLLPDTHRLEGRLEGDLAWSPFTADLRLADARFAPAPSLPLLTLDGNVRLDGERGSTTGLRVRGPGTDLVIEADWDAAAVAGRVRGERLDTATLWSWVEHFSDRPDAGDAPSTAELGLELDVALDAVQAGRSEARNLRTRLQLSDGELRLAPLALDTYEGRVEGEVARSADERLRIALDVRDVTGRFLDDFFFPDEPRGIRGSFGGRIEFEGPAARGLRPTLAEGSGSLVWSARQGSFGRLGLATKLISVLRTAEVLRLKLPSVRDEGLVFDTVNSSSRMEAGRLRLESFRLDAPVYAITASGRVDFAEDTSHVPIEFDALHGVSAILEPIPVAGDALKVAHVRLVASGSPYQMGFRVASFRDQVVGASMAVPNATVTRVRDALELLKARPAEPETSGPPATAPESEGSKVPQEAPAAP